MQSPIFKFAGMVVLTNFFAVYYDHNSKGQGVDFQYKIAIREK
jgi:hypothetical protein